MNINITFVIQIFNFIVLLFVLKVILLDKVLQVLRAKELDQSALVQKLASCRNVIFKSSQENSLLLIKFKHHNLLRVEELIDKNLVKEGRAKDLSAPIVCPTLSESEKSNLANRFAGKIISKIDVI